MLPVDEYVDRTQKEPGQKHAAARQARRGAPVLAEARLHVPQKLASAMAEAHSTRAEWTSRSESFWIKVQDILLTETQSRQSKGDASRAAMAATAISEERVAELCSSLVDNIKTKKQT